MAESLESRFQNLHEFVTQARINLDRNNWDYLIGGSETETTLARNRLALDAIGFRPRVLRDVSNVDCSSSLFGKKLRIPVLCAPVGSLEVFEPGGGATVAEATRTFGNGMILSSVSHPGSTRPQKPRATASRSSNSMCAAMPPGSTTMFAARSTRATTRSA
jgi:isopentenyl diphosphate isomerase/L-lactate dehydrogenase-like FMN-dependent dehydrogenase